MGAPKKTTIHLILGLAALAWLVFLGNLLVVELTVRSNVKAVEIGMSMEEAFAALGQPDHKGSATLMSDNGPAGYERFAKYHFPYLWDWLIGYFTGYQIGSTGKHIPPSRSIELRFDDEGRVDRVVLWNHAGREGKVVKQPWPPRGVSRAVPPDTAD